VLSSEFAFHAPKTLDEALEIVGRQPDATKLLAGGMSLMPVMNLGLATPEVLVSLNHVLELAYVREVDGALEIGAMTRHRVVTSNPLIARHCPPLAAAAARIGDVQVRNRGTIGGSVSHADPSADYLAVLSALGASFRIRSARGERRLTASQFLLGVMETALQPDEVLIEVIVPKLASGTGSAYVRLTRVEGSFAIVNAAAIATPDSVIVAVGGASTTPQLLRTPQDAVRGGSKAMPAWAESAAREACAANGEGDVESEYRTAMAGVYARRAVELAIAERDGSPKDRFGSNKKGGDKA